MHADENGRDQQNLKVLITGASGFIGSHLVPALTAEGFDVVAASRAPMQADAVEWRRSPQLGPDADWSGIMRGIDTVVHLAGRAHVLQNTGSNEEDFCQRINSEGTRSLARQAAQAGVRHFVFLSSCHAVAEESPLMLTRATPPHPASAYGRSKLAAEKALSEELGGSGCAWTILRPPLVYGAGNKANFARLVTLVRRGWPLPLSGVRNRRSFLGAANLADFTVRCCSQKSSAQGEIYYPADNLDLSTPELLRLLGQSVRVPVTLFHVPPAFLGLAGRIPGLRPLRKLTASLFVDSAPAREEFAWQPPHATEALFRSSFGAAS